MARSTDENTVYPNIQVNRELYYAYMSMPNRPKPAQLLEFAICAYMNVESGQEAMFRNTLEMSRQIKTAFDEQKMRDKALQDEIERAKKSEAESKLRKMKLYVAAMLNKYHYNPNDKYPLLQRDVPDTYVLTRNERVMKEIRSNIWQQSGGSIQGTNVSDDLIFEVWYELHPELLQRSKSEDTPASSSGAAASNHRQQSAGSGGGV